MDCRQIVSVAFDALARATDNSDAGGWIRGADVLAALVSAANDAGADVGSVLNAAADAWDGGRIAYADACEIADLG